MAHRVFGTIDEFDPRKDDWDLYESKFDFYLQANEVKDEKVKRAMLLSGIGMVSLGYVRDLNLPTLLTDDSVTYKKLIDQLRAHYGKKSTSLTARNEFAKIRQREGQSIDEFAAALRSGSLLCKFAATELDNRLRDQLVIGLRDEAIRKRLMEKEDATCADVIKFAGDLERVSRESRQVGHSEASLSKLSQSDFRHSTSNNSGAAAINPRKFDNSKQSQSSGSSIRDASSKSTTQPRMLGCLSCGSREHHRAVCWYFTKGLKCRKCGLAGHKATVCPKRSINQRGESTEDGKKPLEYWSRVKAMDASPDEEVECNALALNTIEKIYPALRKCDAKSQINAVEQFVVTPRVNGILVRMDLDTCAETSIASRELWEQLRQPRLRPAPRLRAYGGSEVFALGECDVEVEYQGRKERLPLVCIDSTREKGLFGRPWIDSFRAVTVNTISNEPLHIADRLLLGSDC